MPDRITEATPRDCDMEGHTFEETYYGYACVVCQHFIPFGSEPWAPEESWDGWHDGDDDEADDE